MQKIAESEVWKMAGDADCPVIYKEESEPKEAAVCLKRFPTGYIIGVSDKDNGLQCWFTTEITVAEEEYQMFLQKMQSFGTPFGKS